MTELREWLHRTDLRRIDKLLLILNSADKPWKINEIRSEAVGHGLREARGWNIADMLARAKGSVARTPSGWQLLAKGRGQIEALNLQPASPLVVNSGQALRKHLAVVSDSQARSFIEEAISCFEYGNLRAAVVLSWVGAVAVLQQHVLKHHLNEFNAAGVARFPSFKQIKKAEQFGRIQESEFLLLLEDAAVLHKNVKQQLEDRLKLRNACGHPTPLRIAEHSVASHIELLVLNVFSRFSL